MPKRSPGMLLDALSGPQPLTLPQLQEVLLNASPATTFRYLRQVPYVRSYNENGRYYTLFDPQRFDSFGLLSLGTVRFSQDRSLTATLPRLVNQAEAGWTDKELQHLLHVPVHGPLLDAVRRDRIQREPIHGVFVYLSADAQQAHSPPIRLEHITAVLAEFDLEPLGEKGGPAHS
ncbi:MAG: hypothetical protein OXN89_13380 [Bryobacterales bacterium]|nr:hypothetical protein [Bryobacterales bacterium]